MTILADVMDRLATIRVMAVIPQGRLAHSQPMVIADTEQDMTDAKLRARQDVLLPSGLARSAGG